MNSDNSEKVHPNVKEAANNLRSAISQYMDETRMEENSDSAFQRKLLGVDVLTSGNRTHFSNILNGIKNIPGPMLEKFKLLSLGERYDYLYKAAQNLYTIFNANKMYRKEISLEILNKTLLDSVASLFDGNSDAYISMSKDELFKFPTVACILSAGHCIKWETDGTLKTYLDSLGKEIENRLGGLYSFDDIRNANQNACRISISHAVANSIHLAVSKDQALLSFVYDYFECLISWWAEYPILQRNLENGKFPIIYKVRHKNINSLPDFTVTVY